MAALQTSDEDKEAMYRAFAERLPHRSAAAVREYCNIVIGSISEEVGPDGRWVEEACTYIYMTYLPTTYG